MIVDCTWLLQPSDLGLRPPAEVVAQPDAGVDLGLPPPSQRPALELGLPPLGQGVAVLLVGH